MPADLSFADRVLCVGLRSSCYGTQIQDAEQTEFLLSRNESSKGSLAAKKSRLAEGVAPIKKLVGATRVEFNRLTLPGLSRGDRIILAAELPRLRQKVDNARSQLDNLVDVLISDFDIHLQMDAKKLGRAFKRDDYPTDPSFLRAEFDLRLTVSDLPRGEFSRVMGVARADEAALAEQFREQLAEVGETARRTVLAEYVALIRHVIDVMSDTDRTRYFDSTFDNIREYAARVPALNITNDPVIANLHAQVQAHLATVQMDHVKNSAVRKAEVARVAGEILSSYGNLGSGRRLAV